MQYVSVDNNSWNNNIEGVSSDKVMVPIVYAPSPTDNPKKANKAKKKAQLETNTASNDAPPPPPPVADERTPTSHLDALVGPYVSNSINALSAQPQQKQPTSSGTITSDERAYTRWLQESVRHVVGGLLWRLCLVYKGGMYLVTDPRFESSVEAASEYKARKPDGYISRILLFISLNVGGGGGSTTTTTLSPPKLPTHP